MIRPALASLDHKLVVAGALGLAVVVGNADISRPLPVAFDAAPSTSLNQGCEFAATHSHLHVDAWLAQQCAEVRCPAVPRIALDGRSCFEPGSINASRRAAVCNQHGNEDRVPLVLPLGSILGRCADERAMPP